MSAIEWAVSPVARRPSTMLLPRLRSTKNSGFCSFGRDIAMAFPPHGLGRRASGQADHVLDLIGRDAEVRRDLGHGVTGLEAVDEILYASTAVNDERETERDLRVDNHLGVAVGRQPHRVRPAVSPVVDALQVILDYAGELALLGPDDDQIHDLALTALVRVIEKNLGPIRIEAL